MGFFLESGLFGVGLAMDAFSASLANGLKEPDMRLRRVCVIAGVFALFQTVMPLIGWLCVHTLASRVTALLRLTPWIALLLLSYIGGRMLWEGIRYRGAEQPAVGAWALIGQGLATSIDALSVGFAIAGHGWRMALGKALIIGAVTFVLCAAGLYAGKKGSAALSGKASILGGVILIAVGVEIFATGIR